MKHLLPLLLAPTLLTACNLGDTPRVVPTEPVLITAAYQTAKVSSPADSDDPAIWVNPVDASRSMVVATRKDGGATVFDLTGQTLQDIAPNKVRYNNADIVYGFMLGGQRVDLAVMSDRRNDRVVAYAIDPVTRQLRDVTSPATPLVFTPAGKESDGANTAYGLATYRTAAGAARVLVSQRKNPVVAELELFDDGRGVSVRPLRRLTLPAAPAALTIDNPQVEGMVADAANGVAYLGQEQVGIWKWSLTSDAVPTLLDTVKPGGQRLTHDVEGLTIAENGAGRGYLLASSQGDNTFAVYDRSGSNAYLGSFKVTAGQDRHGQAVDGSEECDGAQVVTANLGGEFTGGLLVVQDGYVGGVKGDTNFKLVRWADVLDRLKLR